VKRAELAPPLARAKAVRSEIVEIAAHTIVVGELARRPRPRRDVEVGALEQSIRERGLDRPLRVRRRAGRFELVDDPEILAACLAIDSRYPVSAIVLPRGADDDAGAALAQLAEHAHRVELRTHELAADFHRLSLPPHSLTAAELARRTGYNAGYVANLVRIRTKLAPALWSRWTEVGEALPLDVLLCVLPLAPDEQPAELELLLTGRRKRPKPPAPRVSRRAIGRARDGGERARQHKGPGAAGAEHALRWVLGETPWRPSDPEARKR
jgi:ParB-like chromosome segregation protein Spo0J